MGDSSNAWSSSDEDDWSQSEEDVWSPSLREDVFAGTDMQHSGSNEPRHIHLPPLVPPGPHSSASTHPNATRPSQPQTSRTTLPTSSQTRLPTPLHRNSAHTDLPSLPLTQSRIEANSHNNISHQRQVPQYRGTANFFPFSPSPILLADLMNRDRAHPEQRSDTPDPRQRSPSFFRDFEYSLAENLSRPDTPRPDYNYNDFVDLTSETSPANMSLASGQRKSNRSRRSTEAAAPPHSAKRRRTTAFQSNAQTVEEVDLRDVDDDKGLSRVLEQQRMATIKAQQEQADMPVKLSTKQCIICMDQMTNITVTHCGHPFCHSCLMEALIAGENQGPEPGKGPSKCPVCRKKVKRPKDGKDTTQVAPLAIKVKKWPGTGKGKTGSPGNDWG